MSLVRRFTANTVGRDLIVGDIHGHFTKLATALGRIGFDPERDRLFSVGDLVDRGPESHKALAWLDLPWFFAVQGNHEDMAIRWGKPDSRVDARLYGVNGGAWNIANDPETRARFSDAFSQLPLAIEIETPEGLIGIVHADCPFDSWGTFTAALEDPNLCGAQRRAIRETALWSRSRISSESFGEPVTGVRAVVVGHTPVEQATSLANVHYIDTGAWTSAARGFVFLDAATLAVYRVVPRPGDPAPVPA